MLRLRTILANVSSILTGAILKTGYVMKEIVHQHILVKAYVSRPPMDEEKLKQWLRDLVADMDMKVCLPPQAKYVDTVGNRGVTAVIGIETSHIAIHVWDEDKPAMLQMDAYSCKPFRSETVINRLKEFGLLNYKLMRIDRDDGFEIIDNISV